MKRVVSPLIEHFTKKNMCRDFTAIEGERCVMVNITFPTANYQQSYYFQPNPVLDGENAIITSLQFISYSELSNINTGQTNRVANLATGVLYISNLRKSVIATLPLTILNETDTNFGTSGKPCWTWFTDHVWQNCYIEFTNSGFSTTDVCSLLVYYVPRVADKNK